MKSSDVDVRSVASVRQPKQIPTSGFQVADESAHMIEWLGKGKDFRQFIVNDAERELYLQDPSSQVLSLRCVDRPTFKTTLLRQEGNFQKGILSACSAAFSLSIRIGQASGVVWTLGVQQTYHATNLETPGAHKLRLEFTVVSQSQEKQQS